MSGYWGTKGCRVNQISKITRTSIYYWSTVSVWQVTEYRIQKWTRTYMYRRTLCVSLVEAIITRVSSAIEILSSILRWRCNIDDQRPQTWSERSRTRLTIATARGVRSEIAGRSETPSSRARRCVMNQTSAVSSTRAFWNSCDAMDARSRRPRRVRDDRARERARSLRLTTNRRHR